MVDLKTFGATLWRYKMLLICVITPLALLPLPLLVPGKASQCGYVMLLMAVYWCTESLPLPVTGMIPIFLMPTLGLIRSQNLVMLYMKESTMMFMGGLMVALAFQRCHLHRRVALSILSVMGVKPIWLMFGFMASSWFLSMWICNAATTLMMLTILEAVLTKLGDAMKAKKCQQSRRVVENGYKNIIMDNVNTSPPVCNVDMKCLMSNGVSNGHLEKQTCLVEDDETERLKACQDHPFEHSALNEDSSDVETDDDIFHDPDFIRLSKGMTLATVYAANIGGSATLTGSAPNVVMKNFADKLWMDRLCTASPVNFASWMLYGTPTALITVFIIWIWLALIYIRPRGFRSCCSKVERGEEENSINTDIKKELKELGKMRYSEWVVLFIFVTMVMLWFFRSPGFISGWADVLRPRFISDSMVSLMCTVALFIIPMHPLKWGSQKRLGKVETLLNWQTIQEKFPWSLIFLIGGGFALAEASLVSGLSSEIGKALTVFDVLPTWLMVSVIALITAFLTEVTSNPAACSLVMPIVANMAEKLDVNPLYFMFPGVLATSYAFLLPVATPPNAIAFSYGRITVLDMIKAGGVLKLTVFVLTLATETWGMMYFHFDKPLWNANATALCSMN